jgi:molybdopterin-guanine dinucleotide biosynthesis protein A
VLQKRAQQAENGLALLGPACARIFLSLRDGQAVPAGCKSAEVLRDNAAFGGPLAGILTAFEHAPQAAWLVLACDLPFVSENVVAGLLAARGETESRNLTDYPKCSLPSSRRIFREVPPLHSAALRSE